MPTLETLTKLTELNQSKGFLGQEYLTWLWYLIEDASGSINLNLVNGTKKKLEIWVDDKINLEASSARVHRQSLRGGTPSTSLEATAALLSGKTVTELKLGLIIDDQEYSCSLNHKDLNPRSVVLPKMTSTDEGPADEFAWAEAQLDRLTALLDILDGLFHEFINSRITSTWTDLELTRIRSWIQQRSQGDLTLH
jgi:hypothetical protein